MLVEKNQKNMFLARLSEVAGGNLKINFSISMNKSNKSARPINVTYAAWQEQYKTVWY